MRVLAIFSLLLAVTLAAPGSVRAIRADALLELTIPRIDQIVNIAENRINDEFTRAESKMNEECQRVAIQYPDTNLTVDRGIIDGYLLEAVLNVHYIKTGAIDQVNALVQSAFNQYGDGNQDTAQTVAVAKHRIDSIVQHAEANIYEEAENIVNGLLGVYATAAAQLDAVYQDFHKNGNKQQTVTKGLQVIQDAETQGNAVILGGEKKINSVVSTDEDKMRAVVQNPLSRPPASNPPSNPISNPTPQN